MNFSRLCLLLASAAVAACVTQRSASTDSVPATVRAPADSGESDSVQVAVEQPSYHAGDMVALRLINRTSQTLGYNACTRTLQRNRIGVWLTVADTGRMCTMELRLLAPGASQMATTLLQSALVPGEYRLILHFSPQGESAPPSTSIDVASNSFRVE
jgi:Big-like domain-containing protein